MNQLVSVIVPVYNTEKYLEKCVETIRAQDYQTIEIVLVDDGSPDRSGELCDKLARTDSRIQVIHKENGGLSSSRNAGIAVARGEYLCFIDSDDYISTDYISTMMQMVNRHHADLVKVDFVEVFTRDYTQIDSAPSEVVFEGTNIEEAFLDLKIDSACVFLYKRSLIGEIRFPEGKTSEDIPFNFLIFQHAEKFVYIPCAKYFYFHNPNSISNGSLDKNKLNYLHFRRDIFEHYCEKDNLILRQKAEMLYAKAAMGLLARMALYGAKEELNENECRILLKKEFIRHQKAFFVDSSIPLNRKALAFAAAYFYPVLKLFRGIIR